MSILETAPLIYTIQSAPTHSSRFQIHVTEAHDGPRPLDTIAPPDPTASPFAHIAERILSHYLRTQRHEAPDRAASLARQHRSAISRLISARLSSSKTGSATLSNTEIAARLLKHILSPPIDHWIQRYSVPSSSSNTHHTVAEKDDGTWGCTCAHFRFRHVECGHIKDAKAHPTWFPYQPPA